MVFSFRLRLSGRTDIPDDSTSWRLARRAAALSRGLELRAPDETFGMRRRIGAETDLASGAACLESPR